MHEDEQLLNRIRVDVYPVRGIASGRHSTPKGAAARTEEDNGVGEEREDGSHHPDEQGNDHAGHRGAEDRPLQWDSVAAAVEEAPEEEEKEEGLVEPVVQPREDRRTQGSESEAGENYRGREPGQGVGKRSSAARAKQPAGHQNPSVSADLDGQRPQRAIDSVIRARLKDTREAPDRH